MVNADFRSKVFLRRFKRPKKKTDRVVAETAVITAGRWFGLQASATCSQIGLANLTIFISDEAVTFEEYNTSIDQPQYVSYVYEWE